VCPSDWALGETTDGVQCVKFGMLANAEDLDDLVALVSKVGREIEESSKVCNERGRSG
jgi:hypothetical protein